MPMPNIFELSYSETFKAPGNKFEMNINVLNNSNSIVVNLAPNDTLNIIEERLAVRVISSEGMATVSSNEPFTIDYSDNLPLLNW